MLQKKVVVTGAAGFIGSNFVRMTLERRPDWHIVGFDALTYAGNLANLDGLADTGRFTFVYGDICDPVAVGRTVAGADGIINFAAESHVTNSIADCRPFLRSNVDGVRVLLDAVRQFGIPRMLHVSTDEVYGSLGSDGFFTETTPLAPNSPYSASKAAGDMLIRAYHQTYGVPVVITRCSNNYGPFQFPEKLIPYFISLIMRKQPLPIHGSGLAGRDWIHVLDHCRGVLCAFENGEAGEVYNLGGNNELSNLELTRRLLQYLGMPDYPTVHVADRPGQDMRYAIDASKARSELGWEPVMSFDVAMGLTFEWYVKNRQWTDDILCGAYRQRCQSFIEQSSAALAA